MKRKLCFILGLLTLLTLVSCGDEWENPGFSGLVGKWANQNSEMTIEVNEDGQIWYFDIDSELIFRGYMKQELLEDEAYPCRYDVYNDADEFIESFYHDVESKLIYVHYDSEEIDRFYPIGEEPIG